MEDEDLRSLLTEEMIEAGIEEAALYSSEDSLGMIVTEVFLAMIEHSPYLEQILQSHRPASE